MRKKFVRTISYKEIIMSCTGVILGIGGVALLAEITQMHLIIAPFGASAILLYSATSSPLAQPRNLVGGHFFSALIAITCCKLMGSNWYAMALAVMLAMLAMMLTGTIHPPGGATALLCIMQGITHYTFLITPIAAGLAILLATAILSARIFPGVRPYPYNRPD